MNHRMIALTLALSIFLSACGSEARPAPAEAGQPETVQIPSLPETTCPTEPAAIEALPIPEDDEFHPKTVLLNPAALRPASGQWAPGGNLVYFGHCNAAPIVWRVLAPSPDTQTVDDRSDCLLLDCGSILENKAFDDNFSRNDGQQKQPSEWKGSDLELSAISGEQ